MASVVRITMTTTNKRRTIYFLVSVMTVIAGLVFLRTLMTAVFFAPDSVPDQSLPLTTKVRIFGTASAVSVPSGANASGTIPVNASPAKVARVRLPLETDPVLLSIPRLDINASVQMLGIKANGNLASPSNFTDVGWYAGGTVPGDIGSAVFDGHVDNGLALAGVFKHLSDIAVGDKVAVKNRAGTISDFIVTDIQSYDYKNAPADMIFNQNNGIFVKLITCGGAWVPGDKTYDRRIVATAVLVK